MPLLLIILLVIASETDSSPKIVNYSSKNIVYYPKQELVILLDSARVSYGDVLVNADSIEYDLQARTLSAFKNVVFVTGSDKVDGNKLFYNLESKRGFMRDAQTMVENGFVNGKEIWLVKEKTLHIRDGYYTTCDHDPPHYYFYSSRSRVLIDNTAIAQPVVMKIFGIPCAAAPFWFFPISKHRKSGLLPFKFGQSSSDGRYAKGIAYYLVINDYADMTFMLDVMEKRGFQPKLEAVYVINPFANGQIYTTYIRETDSKRQRYSINAKHRSDFLFGSNLNAYIDYQTDQSYLPDYAVNEAQWLKKEIYSQVSLNRDFKRVGRASLLVEQKKDFEKAITEWKLPSVGMNFFRLPLSGNWNLTPGISFANSEKKYDSTETNQQSRTMTNRSFGGRLSFSNPKTFLGAFDLPINVGYQSTVNEYADDLITTRQTFNANTGFSTAQTIVQTWNFSEAVGYFYQKWIGDSALSRYDLSFNSNLTLFRLFDVKQFGIENIMHRVIPNISYNITPTIKSYDTSSLLTKYTSSSINFYVNNIFQGKLAKTDEKRDLAVISVSTNYDFRIRKVNPFSINADLYLLNSNRPGTSVSDNVNLFTNISMLVPWLNGRRVDIKFSNLTINTSFLYSITKKDTTTHNESGLRISLNHLFVCDETVNGFTSQTNMINAMMSIYPEGWRFDFSSGINFKERQKIPNYSISVWKDLHCWEAVIDFNKFGSQWAYDFKLRIKKIPDVSFSKGILGFVLPF